MNTITMPVRTSRLDAVGTREHGWHRPSQIRVRVIAMWGDDRE